ncbi:glycosyltransferase [Chryseobacterium sp. sg2396]|uniref:glycosyltransferase n=1 Tax=Chryseobacterium sp. sg2396 TaxID=3276280 RepID=UPI0025D09BDD|nr:glycosyltransferase [uncultured Chryseobacterium sp.]
MMQPVKKIILFRIRSMDMGGVPKVLINILENLDREKFEPFLLIELRQGELVKDIPRDIRIVSLVPGREEMSGNKLLLFFRLAVRHLKLKCYRFFPSLQKKKIGVYPDIEVSITHSSLPAMVRSPFTYSRKISWFHTDLVRHHSTSKGKRIARMMNRCDTNVFVCRSILANLEQHLNVKIHNPVYIYNTFDREKILIKSTLPFTEDVEKKILARTPLFVSIGRLCHEKGYDLLIEAHAELIHEGFNHSIAIIGWGPNEPQLRKAIRKHSVEGSFFLLGNKNNPYPYLLAANYYIQSSRYEAYPLAVGEALALNKPLISTRAGGVEELITHRENGYLTEFSREGLKKAIIDFLSNPSLVNHISKQQKTFDFNKYNQHIYQQTRTLFDDTLYERNDL